MRDITIPKGLHDRLLGFADFQITRCGRSYNPDGTVTFPISDEVYQRLMIVSESPQVALELVIAKMENRDGQTGPQTHLATR